jgi:hypothetical protein
MIRRGGISYLLSNRAFLHTWYVLFHAKNRGPGEMPYRIVKVPGGRKYEVMNLESGKGHGKTTKSKAVRQERLLRAIEHGYVPNMRR